MKKKKISNDTLLILLVVLVIIAFNVNKERTVNVGDNDTVETSNAQELEPQVNQQTEPVVNDYQTQPQPTTNGGSIPVYHAPPPPSPALNISYAQEITAMDITSENQSVTVYWEVQNGFGCCNTFHCNMETFTLMCLQPFTLYDIYLDDVKYDWSASTGYNYTCSNNTPWNYFSYNNLPLGEHTIKIEQKNCLTVVDTEIINFNLTSGGIIR